MKTTMTTRQHVPLKPGETYEQLGYKEVPGYFDDGSSGWAKLGSLLPVPNGMREETDAELSARIMAEAAATVALTQDLAAAGLDTGPGWDGPPFILHVVRDGFDLASVPVCRLDTAAVIGANVLTALRAQRRTP